jgi:hypothetical protein
MIKFIREFIRKRQAIDRYLFLAGGLQDPSHVKELKCIYIPKDLR